jgi:hypothetical protein
MFKVFIQFNPVYDGLDLYFTETLENRQKAIALPMKLEWKIFDPVSDKVEPSLQLYGPEANAFLDALAEALDKNGIKTDKDAKIQGTLEATRYHLEDLRTMLKLNKED